MFGFFLVPRTIALSAALALAPAPVFAQDARRDPSNAGAAAIEKGRRGISLYEHGDWPAAFEQFETAEALYHSPVFLLYAARSLRNAGRLREAKAWFSRLTAEPLDASAPELWQRAQEDGRVELRKLEEQIRNIETAAALAAPSVASPPPPVASPLPPVALPPPHAAVSTGRGYYVPGLVIAGAGGVAIAAGGVVGLLALSRRSALREDLPSSCDGMQCPISQKSSIESSAQTTRDLSVAADALWISGVAVAAVGVVLLLVDPRAQPAAISAKLTTRGGSLRLAF